MSILSKLTGIHISPSGAHLSTPDPIGAVKDAVHNPLPVLGALALPGVGGALGGLLGAIPGASAVGSALSSIPGVGAITSGIGKINDIADKVGGSALGDAARALNGGKALTLGNLAGEAKSAVTGNGGLNALGIAQGVSSILDQKKAGDYANKAVNTAQSAYDAKAPLRAQSLEQLLHPQAPDLSNLQGIAGQLAPSAVAARPVSEFTAPTRQPSAVDLRSLLQNNPYAAKAA